MSVAIVVPLESGGCAVVATKKTNAPVSCGFSDREAIGTRQSCSPIPDFFFRNLAAGSRKYVDGDSRVRVTSPLVV